MLLTAYRKQAMRSLGKGFSLGACLLKDEDARSVVAHVLNPSTTEAEVGEFLSSRPGRAAQSGCVSKQTRKKNGEEAGPVMEALGP